jgi:hypothetical protein
MRTIKTRVLTAVAGLALFIGGVAVAQKPRQNVSGELHPNIAAAQRLCRQAWDRILAAQQANEWDMDGHAQRAKNLLDDVSKELKLAAEAANRNPR